MTRFADLPVRDRAEILGQVVVATGIDPVILEKDFWVTWTLARVFALPETAEHVVFKGGTSLSKVYRAITRFSEDVDLSVPPDLLGFPEAVLDDPKGSRSGRSKAVAKLNAACETHVRDLVMPALEADIRTSLGAPAADGDWLRYELDKRTNSPVLWFAFPSALPGPGGYVPKLVKLEFGSLTCQRPAGHHDIRALLADAGLGAFDDAAASVVALDVERTFWEKATILHAEFHRPADRPLPDRYSRHYSDFAALWGHAARQGAVAREALLDEVARHKALFFGSSWATYDTARRGTLRLSPPPDRQAALRQDYEKMRPMFLTEPPSFDDVLRVLAAAESEINRP